MNRPLRIIVCGGRNFGNPADANDPNRLAIIRELDRITHDEGPADDMSTWMPRDGTVIAVGGAPGADQCAEEWAVVNWVTCHVYEAEWDKHGRAAGPIRNVKMLADFRPDLVVAFPGGRGTANMIKLARAAGVPVVEPLSNGR